MDRRRVLFFFGIAASVSAATGDPLAELDNALVRLRAHRSYAWETKITPRLLSRDPGAPAPAPRVGLTVGDLNAPEPDLHPTRIVAATDLGIGTVITTYATFGDREEPVQIVLHRETGVAQTADGWQTGPEIDASLANSTGQNRMPLSGVPPRITYGVARAGLSLQPPAEELTRLLAGSNPPMMADRRIVATLSEATARQFFKDCSLPSPLASQPGRTEGSVAIWLKDGEIVKYEIAVRGVVAEGDIKITKITTIDRYDRARVIIPAGALRKLAG